MEGWSGEPASTDLPQQPASHSLDLYFTPAGNTFFLFFLKGHKETHRGTRLKELSVTLVERTAGGGASHARLVLDGPPEGSGKECLAAGAPPRTAGRPRVQLGESHRPPRAESPTRIQEVQRRPARGSRGSSAPPAKWGLRGLQLPAAHPLTQPPGSDRGLEPPTRCTHFPPRARPGSGASCAQSGAVRSPATPLRAARLTCSRWRWRRPGAAACPARPYPPRPAPSCPGH